MVINTNWYIITGAPCAGKTKVIEYLASLGYVTVPEAARTLIDAEIKQGKTIQEVRSSEAEFQKRVFRMKIEVENKLPPEQIVFIDGGAIPSSIAYYQIAGLSPAPAIKEAKKRKYKGVFFLERLPHKNDYARVEDEKATLKLDRLLSEAYRDLGYEVIRVPIKPIEERVQFILSQACL